MSELVTSTDWRGVPCTMRYSNPNGKPVLVGDVTAGENVIRGGQAPHKEGSTGYVSTDRGSYYVGTVNAYWDPDFEPNAWAVMCRIKKKGRKAASDWEEEYTYSIERHGDDEAYLMAQGRSRLLERNPDLECYVKAVREPLFED